MVCLTYVSGCVAQVKAELPTCLFVFALICLLVNLGKLTSNMCVNYRIFFTKERSKLSLLRLILIIKQEETK